MEWEASYVDALLNGKTLPKPKPTIRNADAVRRLFRGVSPRREVSPPRNLPASSTSANSSRVVPPFPEAVAVKQESFQFRRALTGLTGQCIDLCSPPKKVSKTAITSDVKAEMPEEVTSNAAGVVDLHAEPVGIHSPSHSDPVPAEASAALVLSPGSQMDVASDVVDPMDDLEAELETLHGGRLGVLILNIADWSPTTRSDAMKLTCSYLLKAVIQGGYSRNSPIVSTVHVLVPI